MGGNEGGEAFKRRKQIAIWRDGAAGIYAVRVFAKS
jgi:hypothetical protein